MRRAAGLWDALRVAMVVAACVASGTLECGGRAMTEPELRGSANYARMCAVCHGATAKGYAADFAPAIGNPQFLSVASDRFLQTAIHSGRGGTTMSAWAALRGGPLVYKDVEAVVALLRTFEQGPRAELDDGPPRGDATRGAATFAARCVGCHGDRGATGPYVRIGSADFLGSAGNGLLRATILEGRPGTPMPAFEAELGTNAVEDLVAALRSWQARQAPAERPAPAKPPPLPLGPVPLNPKGPEPVGFSAQPATTPVDIVKRELARGARMGILDARAPSDYVAEHITGAVSVPFYEPDPYFDQLPRDAWLVCYCSCPHAESGQLAHKLAEKGFKKVTVLDEGLRIWKGRSYPVSVGAAP